MVIFWVSPRNRFIVVNILSYFCQKFTLELNFVIFRKVILVENIIQIFWFIQVVFLHSSLEREIQYVSWFSKGTCFSKQKLMFPFGNDIKEKYQNEFVFLLIDFSISIYPAINFSPLIIYLSFNFFYLLIFIYEFSS